MIKEYRTIQEVAGPLMLVKNVVDVSYDELGEVELPNGQIRRCKVLEVNGNDVLVQLFESSAGINLAHLPVDLYKPALKQREKHHDKGQHQQYPQGKPCI